MMYWHVMRFALHWEHFEVEIPDGWVVVKNRRTTQLGDKICPFSEMQDNHPCRIPLEQWIDTNPGVEIEEDWRLFIEKENTNV